MSYYLSIVLAQKPDRYQQHISVAAMSTSPPPTPPSRAPGDQERRFKDIRSPCEWIEDYHPGGFHPVHLGDLFNDGQFKVIRKLGEGAYSTVWLAHDLRWAMNTSPRSSHWLTTFLETLATLPSRFLSQRIQRPATSCVSCTISPRLPPRMGFSISLNFSQSLSTKAQTASTSVLFLNPWVHLSTPWYTNCPNSNHASME